MTFVDNEEIIEVVFVLTFIGINKHFFLQDLQEPNKIWIAID